MECEVTSKTYNQIQVLPGAARVIGEMELKQKTHGFYISAFTTAMIAAGETQATLITEADSVKVTKAGGSAWVAGDWIFWNETSSNFTNVPTSDLFCVGKAAIAAGNAAVIGFIQMQDHYHPIQLGTAQLPVTVVAGQKLVDIHALSSVVENVELFKVLTTLSGPGATGGRALFQLSTEVALGGWANALKGITDFGSAGSIVGLASGVCAELVMPATAPAAGNYVALEAEIVMPQNTGCGAGMAYMYCNVQGLGKATFQSNGFFAIIDNAGDTDLEFFHVKTVADVDAKAFLAARINGTRYFFVLTTDTS